MLDKYNKEVSERKKELDNSIQKEELEKEFMRQMIQLKLNTNSTSNNNFQNSLKD